MKIRVRDVTEVPEEVEFEQDESELNPLLQGGAICDYRCSAPVRVVFTHYRAGRDLFLDGEIESSIAGRCGRCTEDYDFAISTGFHFLLTPRDESGAESDDEDVDLSLYEGEDVDLTTLVSETVLLSLPTTPLCDEECLGLCPRCGTNLNRTSCDCPATDGDPRMALFRSLRIDR